MLLLTKKELKSHQYAKVYYICGNIFLKKFANDKIIGKLQITANVQVNIETQYVEFVI